MKTSNYHKILLFFVVCMIHTTTYAASEAEYGKLSKAWTLHADGSQTYRYNMELTLFTHTAMNYTYGESFILYNPAYQELEIHASYTRQVDGTIIQTPENAFVEVLPRFAADAPAYNHLKEMVVVHTGLELGATIYLDYSIRTKPGYYQALDIYEFLQETSPVKEYTVSITRPEKIPLNWKISGISAKGKESVDNGNQQISWTLRNIPASSRELFQPQNGDNRPRLIASTYASTVEALAVLNKPIAKGVRMEPEAFASFITEKAKDDLEKQNTIQTHVVKNIGTSNVPLEHTGYNARPVDMILRSAYGTVFEKTQLMQTMLQAVDIPAEIVAVYPAIENVETYGLKAVKAWAVRTTVEGKEYYLSATSLSPSTIPNRGNLDRVISFSGKTTEVTAVPLVVKERKEITVKVSQAKDGYIICTLPPITSGIDSWQMQTTLNSRRQELFEIPALLEEEIVYILTLEPGITLLNNQDTGYINTSFGHFNQSIKQEDDKIIVTRSIKLNQLQYTPAAYKSLRELINAWTNPAGRNLIFKTN